MIVRDATDADTDAVLDMADAFCQFAGEPFDRDFTLINVVAVRNAGFLLVAEDEGEAVGMLAALPSPGLCSPAVVLHEVCMWVKPGHRAGPALLRMTREFDRRAEAMGVHKAQFSALRRSPEGLARVYHGLGYEQADMSFHKILGGR